MITLAIFYRSKFGFLPEPKRGNVQAFKSCYNARGFNYIDENLGKVWAEDFCREAVGKYTQGQTSEYVAQWAEGKADHVEFAAHWKKRGKWSKFDFEERCIQVLPDLITDCDAGTRWKTGGVYEFKNNDDVIYEFRVSPKYERGSNKPGGPVGRCSVHNLLTQTNFNIYGGLYAGDDYGQNRLLPNLKKCAMVSNWHFEYYDAAGRDGVEWHAWGIMPPHWAANDCVSKAVGESGGPFQFHCDGFE